MNGDKDPNDPTNEHVDEEDHIEDAEEDDLVHSSRVTKASYPIREPLTRILRCAMGDSTLDNNDIPVECLRETIPDAVSHLLSNALQALDAMYFQTLAKARNRPSFRHRLCIRVHLDRENQELSITDLGCGMTRADLINVFGMGCPLSHRAANVAHFLKSRASSNSGATQPVSTAVVSTSEPSNEMQQAQQEEDTEDSDDDIYTEDEDYVPPKQRSHGHLTSVPLSPLSADGKLYVPCTSKDIGGFYAALCSLGTKVNVRTKVRDL